MAALVALKGVKRRLHPLYEEAKAPPPTEATRDQILYRPNHSYNVSVLRKHDPNGPGRWETFLTRRMETPNRSPIFGIGVRRALFTHRATALSFSEGALDDVTIEKGSEALGLASIPLYLARAVAQIPTRIVQLQIDASNQRAQLIEAQQKLIASWAAYKQAWGAADPTTRSTRAGEIPALERSCLDASGPPNVCGSLARAGRLRSAHALLHGRGSHGWAALSSPPPPCSRSPPRPRA